MRAVLLGWTLAGWTLAACLLSACAVDTELGLAATIETADVRVTGTTVGVVADVSYRVGAYAEGERTMIPQALDLYVAGDLVTTLEPGSPAGFDARLAPGESARVTFDTTVSGVASPEALCGAEVTVVFRWVEMSTREIGMHEALARDVTCE